MYRKILPTTRDVWIIADTSDCLKSNRTSTWPSLQWVCVVRRLKEYRVSKMRFSSPLDSSIEPIYPQFVLTSERDRRCIISLSDTSPSSSSRGASSAESTHTLTHTLNQPKIEDRWLPFEMLWSFEEFDHGLEPRLRLQPHERRAKHRECEENRRRRIRSVRLILRRPNYRSAWK